MLLTVQRSPEKQAGMDVASLQHAAQASVINTRQCKFLVSFLHRFSSSDNENEDAVPSSSSSTPLLMQSSASSKELSRLTNKTLELLASCNASNWLHTSLLLEEAREEFRLLFEDLCKCLIVLFGSLHPDNIREFSFDKLERSAAADRQDLVQRVRFTIKRMKPPLQMIDERQRYHLLETLQARLGSAQPLVPQKLMIDHSELCRGKSIGSAVYRVKWLRHSFAQKIIPGLLLNSSNNALKEACEILQAVHPNVVRAVGISAHPVTGCCSIVMELMTGGDLRSAIRSRRGRPFSVGIAIDIMLQIARGMRYLHSVGILHLALSTNNILLKEHLPDNAVDEEPFSVKISDFGLSRFYQNAAPKVPRDPKLDVYGFALICFEILTGKQQQQAPEKSIEDACPSYLSIYLRKCCKESPPSFEEICEFLGLIKDLNLRKPSTGSIFTGISATELRSLAVHLEEQWLLDEVPTSWLDLAGALKQWLQSLSSREDVGVETKVKLAVAMGNRYADWKGRVHEMEEAGVWYSMAASLGDAESLWRMGVLSELKGDTAAKKAFEYYQASVKNPGYTNGLVELGRCWSYGLVEQDAAKAREVLQAAMITMQKSEEVPSCIEELMGILSASDGGLQVWTSGRLRQLTCLVSEGRTLVAGRRRGNVTRLLKIVQSDSLVEAARTNLVRLLEDISFEERLLKKMIFVDGVEILVSVLKKRRSTSSVEQALLRIISSDTSEVASHQAVKAGIITLLLKLDHVAATTNQQCLLVECLKTEAGKMWLEENGGSEMLESTAGRDTIQLAELLLEASHRP